MWLGGVRGGRLGGGEVACPDSESLGGLWILFSVHRELRIHLLRLQRCCRVGAIDGGRGGAGSTSLLHLSYLLNTSLKFLQGKRCRMSWWYLTDTWQVALRAA